MLGMLFYDAVWLFTWSIATIVYRLRIRGMHNIPTGGPLLVIANHQSHFDPPAVTLAFTRRHINFIARGGLFTNRFFGAYIQALNAVPIKETGSDTAAIRTALAQLAKGRIVLLFPEGSRSPDATLQEFKRGFWLLMSRAKCPVLPMGIDGAYDAWPRCRKLPRLWGRRIAVSIGKPLSHAQLMAMGPKEGLPYLRQLIDNLRLDARDDLRAATRERYPAPGPADAPAAA